MSSAAYDFATEFQAVFVPKQKPPPEPVPSEERMTLSSYPPMGQVTQLLSGKVLFSAILMVDQTRENEPWQVALWHSSSDREEWVETVLSRTEDSMVPFALHPLDPSTRQFYFNANINIQHSLRFTMKFREAPGRECRWIRDEQGMGDGIIVASSEPNQGSLTDELKDIITHLNPALKAHVAMSQCP